MIGKSGIDPIDVYGNTDLNKGIGSISTLKILGIPITFEDSIG